MHKQNFIPKNKVRVLYRYYTHGGFLKSLGFKHYFIRISKVIIGFSCQLISSLVIYIYIETEVSYISQVFIKIFLKYVSIFEEPKKIQ